MKQLLEICASLVVAMLAIASCSTKNAATVADNAKALAPFDSAGVMSHGAMIQGNPSEKRIALVFTADSLYNGADTIVSAMREACIKGSFFFTGYLYKDHPELIKRLKDEGHYLGTHSYGHLLYATWEDRDSMLVSKEEFVADMDRAFEVMQKCGISKADAPYYIPPYEWYNDTISAWSEEIGLRVINFTPGTGSNADYTVPSMGKGYAPSERIYQKIIKCEEEKSLCGHFMLIHFGVWEERPDKFFNQLPQLIAELKQRGYTFVTVPEMMGYQTENKQP